MDSDNTQKMTEGQKNGNELPEKHQLNEVANAPEKAGSMDSPDRTSLVKSSAASYKLGKYAECIDDISKLLPFLKDDEDDGSLRQRLLVMQARSYLCLSNLDKTKECLEQLRPGKECDGLRSSLQEIMECDALSPPTASLREIVLQLPRSKPAVFDEPEYFGPSDDMARSLYRPKLEESSKDDPVVSMLLGGFTDARFFFQTVVQYGSAKKGPQKLHMTLVDIKPAVVARALVFFSLIQEANANKETEDLVLLSLGYLFCTQVIPPYVWDKLQKTITTLMDKLDNKQQPITFAHLPVSQMDTIVEVLKSWKTGPAIHNFKTADVREYTAELMTELNPFCHELGDCAAEWEAVNHFSAMFPPVETMLKFEPALYPLVQDYRRRKTGSLERVHDYLDEHWRVNVTVIDMKWIVTKNRTDALNLGKNPLTNADLLTREWSRLKVQKSVYCVLKHVADFFREVCRNIALLGDRLTTELVIGDMVDVLERTRFGLLDRPKPAKVEEGQESSTSVDWPQKYHIIWMSNIPDYTGGALMSFLYAVPLLKTGSGTGLTSNAARNYPIWNSIDQYNSEYTLMHDRNMIRKHFSVELTYVTPLPRGFNAYASMLDLDRYRLWEKRESENCSLEQLMSQEQFSRWLYSHFLKICLPFPRTNYKLMIFAPLNTTMFLRLLVHMAELGYPSHWFSTIIGAIARGRISTTARPPRGFITSPADADLVHSSTTMSVKPWAAEFTTLVAQWRRLLPFAALVPSGIIPSLEDINEYSVVFPHFKTHENYVPHFTLLFWNHRLYGEPTANIYRLLLDDEKGDRTASARKIKSDGINIVSTYTFNTKKLMATFWLRKDVVELMEREEWKLYIWRTDDWKRASPAVPVKGSLKRTRNWKECISSA